MAYKNNPTLYVIVTIVALTAVILLFARVFSKKEMTPIPVPDKDTIDCTRITTLNYDECTPIKKIIDGKGA